MVISRRARDADGNEIEPMRISWLRGRGMTRVIATCGACRHSGPVEIAGMPDSMPVPDVGLRLRCSACGGREIETRPDWLDYRAAGLAS